MSNIRSTSQLPSTVAPASTGAGGGLTPTVITASQDITQADNLKMFSNFGSTENVVLTLDQLGSGAGKLNDGFEFGVVNEVGSSSLHQDKQVSLLNFNSNFSDPFRTWTAGSVPVINTTTKKYGAGCLELTGNGANVEGNWVYTPLGNGLVFADKDFCIRFWLNIKTHRTGMLFGIGNSAGAGPVFGLRTEVSGDWKLYWNGQDQAYYGSSYLRIRSNAEVTTNTWYHFAIVRNGASLKTYLNGVGLNNLNIGTSSLDVTGCNYFTIGSHGEYLWRGEDVFIDDFEIFIGHPIHTENFIPNGFEARKGGQINIVPDQTTPDQLPLTASAGSSVQLSHKGDFCHYQVVGDRIIQKAVFPSASNITDLMD